MHARRMTFCSAALVLVTTPVLCRAAVPPARAASVIGPQTKSVHVHARKHYPVVYHDTDGKVIDSATFMQRTHEGQRFSMGLDKQKAHMVFTLDPPGAHPAGSIDMSPKAMKINMAQGQHLPEFALPTVAGRTVRESGLRGRPTLVNFFFAECKPCIAEIPSLNAYARRHPDMRVMAVTFDDKATATAFVAKRHFTWPVVYAGNALVDRLGVSVYPMLALIDARGRFVAAVLSSSLAKGDSVTPTEVDGWVHARLADESAKRTSPTH